MADSLARELIDEFPGLICAFDPEGRVQFLSRSAAGVLGIAGADGERLYALPWQRPFAGEELRRLRRGVRRALRTGLAYEGTHRLHLPGADERSRWFLVRVAPAALVDGRPSRWIATAVDVEVAKANVEHLVAETFPQIVWHARPDGSRQFVSSRWCQVTGRPIEDGLGSRWLQSVHPDDVATMVAGWKRSLRTLEPFEAEYRLRDDRTGIYRWFLVRANPVLDADGSVVSWLGTSVDIDDKRRSEADLQLLLEAGTRLLASLEDREAFDAILRSVVPSHAVRAFIAKVEKGITRVVASAGPKSSPSAKRITGLVLPAENSSATESVRTGNPALWPKVDERWFGALEPGERASVGDYVGASAITVPVRQGHRVVALIAAFGGTPTRRYGERDVEIFCELASRLSIALGTAESYAHERRVAAEFQRAALPSGLPTRRSVAFDAVYEAGQGEALVGGDWYDALELLDGRILISVGDVSGNGLAAAVTMNSVRQSIRAASQVDADPVAILDAADRALRADDPERIVTAFVGVLEPVTNDFVFASAGHPPALVRTPDGHVTELRTRGLPLGLRTREVRTGAEQVRLAPGSLIALYTDGLIEVDRDILGGERRLRRALEDESVAGATSPARALRQRVLEGAARDDVAILTLRLSTTPASSQDGAGLPDWSWNFDSSDHAAAVRARQEFAGLLRAAGVDRSRVNEAEIVFGELTGNAVRHTDGNVDVRLTWNGAHPVLHVLDAGPGEARKAEPATTALSESGRGLFIVSALTEDFTISRRQSGGTHSRAVLRAAPRHVERIVTAKSTADPPLHS